MSQQPSTAQRDRDLQEQFKTIRCRMDFMACAGMLRSKSEHEINERKCCVLLQRWYDGMLVLGESGSLDALADHRILELFVVAVENSQFKVADCLVGLAPKLKEVLDKPGGFYGGIYAGKTLLECNNHRRPVIEYLLGIGSDPLGTSSVLSDLFRDIYIWGKNHNDIPKIQMLLDRRPYNLNGPIRNYGAYSEFNPKLTDKQLREFSIADVLAYSIKSAHHLILAPSTKIYCFQILVHLMYRCGYRIETKRMLPPIKVAMDLLQDKAEKIPVDVQRIVATFIF